MNSLVLTFVLCVACAACLIAGAEAAPTTVLADVEEATTATPNPTVLDVFQFECDVAAWDNFKNEYNKGYESSDDEKQRRDIFCDNLREINKHNEAYDLGKESYKKGINEFSDMTQDEWANTYLMASM